MTSLPINLDLRDRRALVIGAEGEAVSKVDRLVTAGAEIRVLTQGHAVDPAIVAHAGRGSIDLCERGFEQRDLDDVWIVFLVPGDDALAERLHAWAVAERRLLCTLDRSSTCTFTNPAVTRAQGLTVAFSSAGVSPGAMRRLREDLERALQDPRLASFLGELDRLRAAAPPGERREVMTRAVEGFGLVARLVFPAWLAPRRPPDV